jgi:hypothetical protein
MVCEACRHEVSKMLPAIGVIRERRTDLLARLQGEGVTYEALRKEIRDSLDTDANQEMVHTSWLSRLIQWLSQWRRSWVLAPAIGAVAIAAVMVIMWRQPHNAYVGLLEFEPLLYERNGARAIEARKKGDLFGEGMDAYCTGDYAKAAEHLSQVVARDSKNDSAWLYLGVSHYLHKDARPAITALRHVSSSVIPGVRDAAQWYIAEAFLLNNQADSTLQILEQVDRESRWSPKADLLATKLWTMKRK